MKKVIALLLAVAMLACLCACGNNTKDDSKTNNTTQPVGDQTDTTPSKTKVYYKTDAAGSTITTVIVLPDDDSQGSFPLQTATTGNTNANDTTTPTFTYEDDNQFNDATLAW